MSEIISRWDLGESPLVASLKLLYSLNIISAEELKTLSDALGVDYQQIIYSKFVDVNTYLGRIRGYTPIIVVTTSKSFDLLILALKSNKVNYKIYDGTFSTEVTLITPAQFLNAIANIKVPFRKFTLVPINPTKDLDRYLYSVTHYSYYYIITTEYRPRNNDIPSAWTAHYLKIQSQHVSVPEELLQKYNDDADWWKYPWIKTNNNTIDIQKLRDISVRYGIPLQLLKSISRDRNYAERMLKLGGYSDETINKVLAVLFQQPADQPHTD